MYGDGVVLSATFVSVVLYQQRNLIAARDESVANTYSPTRSVTTARIDLYPSSVNLNLTMSVLIASHRNFLSRFDRPSPLHTCMYPAIWSTILVQCSSSGGVRLARSIGKKLASSLRISTTPSRECSSARTASSSARASRTSRMKSRRAGDVVAIAEVAAEQPVSMDLVEKKVVSPRVPPYHSNCFLVPAVDVCGRPCSLPVQWALVACSVFRGVVLHPVCLMRGHYGSRARHSDRFG